MLLIDVPREAAIGPPCPDLSMSSLTKLNFTDYSNKLNKSYDSAQQQEKLSYEQALTRLNYENNTVGATKVQYGEQHRAYDPNGDPSLCLDAAYSLATGMYFFYTFNTV